MPDYIHSTDFLADFASGKEKAFRALHQEFFAKLTTAADGIVKNYPEAEDIAIGALFRLMSGYEKFADKSLSYNRLKNHLYLSVRNRSFDYLESFRRKTRAMDWDISETLNNLCEDSGDESMAFAEGIARLPEILAGMSEERRTAVQLVYFEDKRIKDAAAEMAMPLSTFHRLRIRAIKELSEKLPREKLPTSLLLLLIYLSSILTSAFLVLFSHY